MTHITCRLATKNRDQLRNPRLGNRVWATFTFLILDDVGLDNQVLLCAAPLRTIIQEILEVV